MGRIHRSEVKSLSRVQLFVTLWTIAHQAPQSMDSPGKNTGVGCHFLLQEYTEELYKKDLHDPDNHDGVITHLEPDILDCKVKGLRNHHYEQS